MKELKPQIIEYFKSHICDLIPYNSPNYKEEMQKTAEMLYKAIDEEFNHYKNNEN